MKITCSFASGTCGCMRQVLGTCGTTHTHYLILLHRSAVLLIGNSMLVRIRVSVLYLSRHPIPLPAFCFGSLIYMFSFCSQSGQVLTDPV